jgi:glycosyltransferase involved in cell wall biosynthesis
VVPNGVDTNSFNVGPERSFINEFARNPTSNRPVLFAYLGNVSRHLNFQVLLEAAGDAELDSRVRFVVIGGSADQIAEYRATVSQAALKRLDFLGSIPHSQVPRILENCLAGLICYPTKTGAGGAQTMKLLEYMAAGLPVITTKLLGVAEVLERDYGLYYGMEDSKGLVALINKLTQNPELARQIGMDNQKLALEEYSWEKVGRKLTEIYEGVLLPSEREFLP